MTALDRWVGGRMWKTSCRRSDYDAGHRAGVGRAVQTPINSAGDVSTWKAMETLVKEETRGPEDD